MNVRVEIPGPLRADNQGAPELQLAATSVRGALEALKRDHPRLHRSVCDETGRVRRHVNLFVNRRHVREQQGLETLLAPGDTLTIMPAVSGG